MTNKKVPVVGYCGDTDDFSIVCCYCGPERGGVPVLVRGSQEDAADFPLNHHSTKILELTKRSMNEKYKVWFFPKNPGSS